MKHLAIFVPLGLLVLGASSAPGSSPGLRKTRFDGSFTCAKRVVKFRMELEGDDRANMPGVVELQDAAGTRLGSYRVTASIDTSGRFRAAPAGWLQAAPGLVPIAMDGPMFPSGAASMGQAKGGACTRFVMGMADDDGLRPVFSVERLVKGPGPNDGPVRLPDGRIVPYRYGAGTPPASLARSAAAARKAAESTPVVNGVRILSGNDFRSSYNESLPECMLRASRTAETEAFKVTMQCTVSPHATARVFKTMADCSVVAVEPAVSFDRDAMATCVARYARPNHLTPDGPARFTLYINGEEVGVGR
ncbi:MAG: hypothetical protein ACKOPO_12795 [Novosphingobium sp.]